MNEEERRKYTVEKKKKKMRFSFHRFQLKATTATINHMRYFVDGCTRVYHTALTPFRKVGRQVALEGPWVITVLVCTWLSIVPLFFYPYIKTFVWKDKRTLLEEERVRLCLQKGIDPYPYLIRKDYVYGNNFPGLAREEEYPLSDSWEHQAMTDFHREKELLLRETNGVADKHTVEKLLALRNELRKETKKNRNPSQEPTNLVFKSRSGVDQL